MLKFSFHSFLFLFFFLAYNIQVFSDNSKEKIIITTDCAADDLRAICQVLAVSDIQVDAIITSDGMLNPKEGRIKVLELLNDLKFNSIPISEGIQIQKKASLHHDFLMSVKWGSPVIEDGKQISANDLLKSILEKSEDGYTFMCMGPLTDIAGFIKKYPELKSKIQKIVWYNESVNPLSGTNYEFDKKAYDNILNAKISLHVISNLNNKDAVFTEDYLNKIAKINTPFSNAITESHNNSKLLTSISSGNMKLWDDLLPIYVLYPSLFDMEPCSSTPWISVTKGFNAKEIKEKFLMLLSQNISYEKNIIFEKFPDDSLMFNYDVREIMKEVISKYGKDEWKVCVLTNEIHGHLGTYSIIGAKMGLKAREILHAEIDRINVVSFAGNEPPYSCLNDGLQISTGATLGLGMIEISKDSIIYPSATFSYQNKKIKLILKKSVQEKIDKDISDGIVKYGRLTQGYWKLIREVSLKHWLEFDRNEIFEVQEL